MNIFSMRAIGSRSIAAFYRPLSSTILPSIFSFSSIYHPSSQPPSSHQRSFSSSTTNHISQNNNDRQRLPQRDFEIRPVNVSDLKSNRVYVGNLSNAVECQDLKDLFHERIGGEISRVDVVNMGNNKVGKFGIVELETPELAAKAINTLTNTDLKGRKIFVREDREQPLTDRRRAPSDREGRSRAFSPASSSSSSSDNDGTRLYVGNLPWRTAWQDLKDLFGEYGTVVRADVASDYNGRSRGFGTVKFENASDAQKAIEALHETDYQDRKLIVRLDAK